MSKDADLQQPDVASLPRFPWISAQRHGPDRLDCLIATAPQGDARPSNLEACVIHLAALPNLPASLLVEARSAVSTLAKKLNRSAASIPADPMLLRPILVATSWVALAVSQKREANIRAALQSLLLVSGWIGPEFRAKARHVPAWQSLLDLAMPYKLAGPLGPFARFCAARGIAPEQVTNATLLDYLEARTAHSVELKPRAATKIVSQSWNRMGTKEPSWPQVRLGLESTVNWLGRKIEEFPPTFREELFRYLESLRHPNPLTAESGRPMAEISVQHARRAMLRAATHLIDSGMATIDTIDSLAVLAQPAAYEALLLAAYKSYGGKWTHDCTNIASSLLTLAKRWVKPAPEILAELKRTRTKVKLVRRGLSREVRDRLAQFQDPEVLRDLFGLPDRAFAEAEHLLRNGRRKPAAKLHELALMLAILLLQPIRRKNVAMINMKENFVRNRKGNLERIVINGDAVKNTIMIEIPLPPDLVERIERHVAVFRPLLPGHDLGKALFPAPSGRSLSADQTGRRLTAMIKRQMGVHMTPHDARHLAVTMLLDEDPANLAIAQRLLGHVTPKTTEAIYGTARIAAAQKQYAGIVNRLLGNAKAKDKAKRNRKPREPRS